MSTFSDQVQGTAWDSLAAIHGQTVTYTPYSGEPSSVTGIWTPGQIMPGYYPDGEQEVSVGVLRLSGAAVAAPDIRDTVTIAGTTWAVKSIGRVNPILELQLEAREQRAVGGANARIER